MCSCVREHGGERPARTPVFIERQPISAAPSARRFFQRVADYSVSNSSHSGAMNSFTGMARNPTIEICLMASHCFAG